MMLHVLWGKKKHKTHQEIVCASYWNPRVGFFFSPKAARGRNALQTPQVEQTFHKPSCTSYPEMVLSKYQAASLH